MGLLGYSGLLCVTVQKRVENHWDKLSSETVICENVKLSREAALERCVHFEQ